MPCSVAHAGLQLLFTLMCRETVYLHPRTHTRPTPGKLAISQFYKSKFMTTNKKEHFKNGSRRRMYLAPATRAMTSGITYD